MIPATARRVLDVGCGAGAVGAALKAERDGIEVVGIELFPDAAAAARERLDAVIEADLDTLTQLPYPAGAFDAIVFADVLEHLRDPHRLLRVLRRYLADDGTVVCSLPNVKHFTVLYPLLVHDHWRYADAGLLDRTHVHFFTLAEIAAMFAETGFSAVSARPVVLQPFPAQLEPILDAADRIGGAREQVRSLMEAYQFIVAAVPTGDVAASPSALPPAESRDVEPPVQATPACAAAGATASASLLVVLDGTEQQALACLTAISELGADQPDHEIVIVTDGAPQLDALMERVGGDVAVERLPHPLGFAAAATRGLAHCTASTIVLLYGMPDVEPGFLGPLLDALADDAVAAAASVAPNAPDTPAVATAALAARRADLPQTFPSAPAGLELAALCTHLARRGEIVTVPRSTAVATVTPHAVGTRPIANGRTRAFRRAPGQREIELSIVIPTLDAAGERTRRCVASVQSATNVDHEIIVIDNGAPPQGFTAPVNAGLRAARGRYLLVLNDDVELLPGWWEPLRDALEDGATVVFPHTVDGKMRTDFAAWCFAMSRDTMTEFAVADGEFFDPELVVWFQDTDLLERLRDAGRPPRYVEASKIRHLLSQTVETDDLTLRAWVRRQVRSDKEAFEAKHGKNVAGAGRERR
jgi:GT2 family glycosyltransferase/SAM-dependent methyltransferase